MRRDTSELASVASKYPDLLPLMEDQLSHRITTLPRGLALWVADEIVVQIDVVN